VPTDAPAPPSPAVDPAAGTAAAGPPEALLACCREVLADRGTSRPPAGHPASLGLCVIEAVLAPRVSTTTTTAAVDRYRVLRRDALADPGADGPQALLAVLEELGDDGWAARVGTRHRAWPAPTAPLKATATRLAARALVDAGVLTTTDLLQLLDAELDPATDEPGWGPLRRAWTAVPGQGSGSSWHWLHQLAGSRRVVPDVAARRLVARALDLPLRAVPGPAAAAALEGAAAALGVPARDLDHAAWRASARRGGRDTAPPAAP